MKEENSPSHKRSKLDTSTTTGSIAITAMMDLSETMNDNNDVEGSGDKLTAHPHNAPLKLSITPFRVTTANEARYLTDGVCLKTSWSPDPSPVILPWVGFGTYKLKSGTAGSSSSTSSSTIKTRSGAARNNDNKVTSSIPNGVYQATLQALEHGYRSIDTAFIYGGETTEGFVGEAIQAALQQKILHLRREVFVTTKHWRNYHGYDATMKCLQLSLQRLQLDTIDLYLMHWPGPSNAKRKDNENSDASKDWIALRAETWRAMEDAVQQGFIRAIGVSNMTIRHLQALQATARIWPPAVLQIEVHPLHPQTELRRYCHEQGIVIQAYASLGGQDTGKKGWKQLLGKEGQKREVQSDLLHAAPVEQLAQAMHATPAQVLLRWGLQQECVLIPKTANVHRLLENKGVLDLPTLTAEQMQKLQDDLQAIVRENNPDQSLDEVTRLCWRNDPLRLLNFD
jgi:diketogulonate reductase-like aldo/keto reductase